MIQFPSSTFVGKNVPKAAFYKHMEINAKLKARFVEGIERIVWWVKLSPSTLNAEDGESVHEITVFLVSLKSKDMPDDVFAAIDRQMPRHTVFVLVSGQRYRLLLNYKEWADPRKGTFRIIQSFRTEWTDDESLRLTIKGSNMDKVYESFAGQVSGFGTDNDADTKRVITLQQQLTQKQQAVEVLQKKTRSEKQFNRQLQLNAEARTLKKELAALQEEIDRITNRQ